MKMNNEIMIMIKIIINEENNRKSNENEKMKK